jgi:hypothetical protein
MYVYNNVKREEHLKTSKASAVFVSWALIYSNICQQPKIPATKVSFKVQRDFVLYMYIFSFPVALSALPNCKSLYYSSRVTKKQLFCRTLIIALEFNNITLSSTAF